MGQQHRRHLLEACCQARWRCQRRQRIAQQRRHACGQPCSEAAAIRAAAAGAVHTSGGTGRVRRSPAAQETVHRHGRRPDMAAAEAPGGNGAAAVNAESPLGAAPCEASAGGDCQANAADTLASPTADLSALKSVLLKESQVMRLRGFSLPPAPLRLPFVAGALQGMGKIKGVSRLTRHDVCGCHGRQLHGTMGGALCRERQDAHVMGAKTAVAAIAVTLPVLEAQAQGGAGRQRPRQAAGYAAGGRRLAILRGRIWPSCCGVRHGVFCLHAVSYGVNPAAHRLLCYLTTRRTSGRTLAGWLCSKLGPEVHRMGVSWVVQEGSGPTASSHRISHSAEPSFLRVCDSRGCLLCRQVWTSPPFVSQELSHTRLEVQPVWADAGSLGVRKLICLWHTRGPWELRC